MLDGSHKKMIEQAVAQTALMYPDASIREYLNMRRVTKDKCCLIIFLLYCFGLIIMMGIGFFYGNYNALGLFVNDNFTGDAQTNRAICQQYVSQDYTTCLTECTGTAYLGQICITSTISSYTTTYSSQVQGLIAMYDLKYTFGMIAYITIGLLFLTAIFFILIIYVPKLIYVYTGSLFLMLLGFAFYLLKNVQIRTSGYETTSLFYQNQQSMRYIAFLFLGIYLVIFPFVLFSPKKIQFAVILIKQLKKYFTSMIRMHVFTIFMILICWGALLVEIFLIMNFYSSGTISAQAQQSMFFTYTGIYLYHPAALAFHFIGVYWFFCTFISWHKYFTGTSMCIWYFQQSQAVYPIRRGLKRSLHHVGSAAFDAIFMPLEWLLLLVYSICKVDPDEEQQEQQSIRCATSCLLKFRQFITNRYMAINRCSPASAVLTNSSYFQGCETSGMAFSQKHHKFFNIGGTLTIFLTLFVCILWVLITYFIIYSEVYAKNTLPLISSMNLPIFSVFLIALVIGSLFSNLYTAAIDCLLFCYLMERKNIAENQELQRQDFELKIKAELDTYYYRTEDTNGDKLFVYEELQENTMRVNYISRRQ